MNVRAALVSHSGGSFGRASLRLVPSTPASARRRLRNLPFFYKTAVFLPALDKLERAFLFYNL